MAGTRQAVHRELVNLHAFARKFARHRVAEAAFGIMIFHRDDGVICIFRRRENFFFAERLDAVSIHDGNVNSFRLQNVRRFQRLEQRDARCDHGRFIAVTQNFRAADGELFVVAVNHRRLRTRSAEEANALVRRHLFQQFFRGDGFRRIQHRAADNRAHHGQIFQRHLRRAVFADADADVRADEFHIRGRNSRDANLVCGARKKCRERRDERNVAARRKPNGDGHKVLFRDETFGESVRELFEKLFRVGGIFRVAVHRDDALIGFTNADERGTVSFARGNLITKLVADGGIACRRGEVRRGQSGRRGNCNAETRLRVRRKFRDGLRGLVFAQRFAVPAFFVLDERNARALVSLGDDGQRTFVEAHAAQDFHDLFHVVAVVERFHAPAERFKPLHINIDVMAEHRRLALAETVRVHDRDEIAQLVKAREVRRLPDRAFRDFAVTEQNVGVVIQLVLPRRERHADADAETLAERTRRHIREREARRGMAFEIIAELAQLQKFRDGNKTIFRPRGVEQGSGVAFG